MGGGSQKEGEAYVNPTAEKETPTRPRRPLSKYLQALVAEGVITQEIGERLALAQDPRLQRIALERLRQHVLVLAEQIAIDVKDERFPQYTGFAARRARFQEFAVELAHVLWVVSCAVTVFFKETRVGRGFRSAFRWIFRLMVVYLVMVVIVAIGLKLLDLWSWIRAHL